MKTCEKLQQRVCSVTQQGCRSRNAARHSERHMASRKAPERFCRCQASASAAASQQRARREPLDADIQAAISSSIDLIHEILREVCSSVMTAESVTYLGAGDETASLEYHVQRAVKPRIHRFSHVTLLALDEVMQSRGVRHEPQELEILRRIKGEAVKQVGGYFPDEVRVLEQVCQLQGRARRELLESLAQEQLQALALCAGQVAGDMEDAEAIPDVKLLCNIAVAHEDIHDALNDKSSPTQPAVRPQRSGLPRGVAAFVKELVPVADSIRRRGLVLSALKEGLQPPPRKVKPDKTQPGLDIPPEAASARAAEAAESSAESTPDAPRPVPPPLPNPPARDQVDSEARLERVRPASLLQCVHVIRQEVAHNPPKEVASDLQQLQGRLQDIQTDCLQVVAELASGRHRLPRKERL